MTLLGWKNLPWKATRSSRVIASMVAYSVLRAYTLSGP